MALGLPPQGLVLPPTPELLLPGDPALMGTAPMLHVVRTPDERAQDLITRFNYSDSWRQQYDQKAIEWYKLYVGYRDQPAVQGRSNLHIPRVYEICDTLRARIVKSFLSARPYFEFSPAPPRNGQVDMKMLNEKKGDLAAALVDQQLVLNNFTYKFYNYITSMLIFPLAIMGVGWRYEERIVKRRVPKIVGYFNTPYGPQPNIQLVLEESPEPVWDDNEIVNVDFFDFWVDPRRADIDSARFVFHRDWMTQEELQNYLEVLRGRESGEVFDLRWDELRNAGSNLSEGRWDRLSAVGFVPETDTGFWNEDDHEEARKGNLFEVLHYWENNRHSVLVNRIALAYDGENPYWRHGKKPFVTTCYEPLPGEIYGMSAVQVIEHLQHELNTQRNQRLDNVSLILNRMWKVRRSADIQEQELVSRPHGIIHVDNPDDVTEFVMQNVASSSYQDEMLTKTDMENAIGTPAVVRGANPERKETATEIITKNSNASIRFDVKIMLFEATGLSRLVNLMDMNNQQFIDMERPIKLYGQDDANQWAVVQPGELIGEWDYSPSAANVDPAANKEVRREQLSQVLAFAVQSNDPHFKRAEIYKAWLQAFDFKNPERFLYTDEEVMAMQQAVIAQMQRQQQMAMAQQGAGGQPPMPMPPQQRGGPPI